MGIERINKRIIFLIFLMITGVVFSQKKKKERITKNRGDQCGETLFTNGIRSH